MQPDPCEAMVLVSATPYFPAQARPIMRDYRRHLSAEQWEFLRRSHPGGDPQIEALLRSTESFADCYDDLSFTPPRSPPALDANAGHGPVFGERWSGFLDTAAGFLGERKS